MFLCVHHNGTVPRNRLLERLSGDQQKADTVASSLHRDLVTAIKEYERAVVCFHGWCCIRPFDGFGWHRESARRIAELSASRENIGESVASGLHGKGLSSTRRNGDIDIDRVGGNPLDWSFLPPKSSADHSHVSAVIVFMQQTYQSSTVQLASFDPTPTEIQSFITAAHQRGISVMVRPLMDDTNIIAATNGAQWRGTVSPTDPAAWFQNYLTTVILPYAGLSGIDMFDVGSELTTLGFTYPDRWSTLISTLRSTYQGERLTFSSTDWYGLPGQSQPYPSFAPALDLIGVDAFFPMNGVTNGYDVGQLARAWQPWLSKMAQLGAYYHKPILFTEIGLASQCCTLTQPFVYHAGAAPNLPAQAAYYAAACQAIRPYKIGLYWWAYNALDPVASPTTDNSFTPYGKPAEQEMARCYLGGS